VVAHFSILIPCALTEAGKPDVRVTIQIEAHSHKYRIHLQTKMPPKLQVHFGRTFWFESARNNSGVESLNKSRQNAESLLHIFAACNHRKLHLSIAIAVSVPIHN
jgi:hypothetical protein